MYNRTENFKTCLVQICGMDTWLYFYYEHIFGCNCNVLTTLDFKAITQGIKMNIFLIYKQGNMLDLWEQTAILTAIPLL